MLKILFGTTDYVYLDGPGGVVNQMLSTKSVLETLGHQVDFFNPWETKAVTDYDVFHMFYATGGTYELSRRISMMGPKLVVSSIMMDKTVSPTLIKWANRITDRLPKHFTHMSSAAKLCQMADVTISCSSSETSLLKSAFGLDPKNISVIHNGVDKKFSYANPDLFRSKHGSEKFLLAVGLIGNPRKNFLRLIKIANRLKINLFIIGPVQNNEYAKACLSEAAKGDSVTIVGPVPENELISSYAAAHALILPSETEGTGLVALEAGLAGAAVAITSKGGPPDYFSDYVTYINPRSDKSIQSAIENVMSAQKSDHLRNHILDNFTWDKVISPLANIYERVVTDR